MFDKVKAPSLEYSSFSKLVKTFELEVLQTSFYWNFWRILVRFCGMYLLMFSDEKLLLGKKNQAILLIFQSITC